MSSRSLADGRAIAPPSATIEAETIRLIAIGFLMAIMVFVQLDAIGNRLSAKLPISMFELCLAGLVATTIMFLTTRPATPGPPRATGDAGIRLMLMLMLWAVFAWTLSQYRDEGLSYLIKLATAIAPALCLIALADHPRHIRALLWTMIGAGAVSAVIVLIEAKTHTRLVATSLAATTADFEGVARSSGGSDENPTTAAQMLMVSVALAFGLLMSGEKRGRMLLAGIALIGTAALALMSARSAILGLGFGVGLIVLAFRRERYFPLILLATLIGGVLTIMFAPPSLVARFAAIGDFGQDQTLFRRISYLRIGFDLLQTSPIWGIGPGNFPQHYLADAYRYMPGREMYPRELHNTYLDSAVEYGLIGFTIFAGLIAHALLAARRGFSAGASAVLSRSSFAVVIALAALLVGCVFMPHKDMRYLWLLIALAIQCGRLRAGEDAAR